MGTTCKNCGATVSENDIQCDICRYPLAGTTEQKAKFIARQVMDKSHVQESLNKLRKARNILYGVAAVYLFATVFYYASDFGVFVVAFSGILCVAFVGFALLTFKKPKIALLIPLILASTYYLVLFMIDPLLLWRGILWKMVVLMGLGYGYVAVLKSDRILRANPYLASVLGYSKISEVGKQHKQLEP